MPYARPWIRYGPMKQSQKYKVIPLTKFPVRYPSAQPNVKLDLDKATEMSDGWSPSAFKKKLLKELELRSKNGKTTG
jgi:hypothetical protein